MFVIRVKSEKFPKQFCDVALNVQSADDSAVLEFRPSPVCVEEGWLEDWLRSWLYDRAGHFGHLIGNATTAIDLHAALIVMPRLEPKPLLKILVTEVIEGEALLDGWKSPIPPGAIP